MKKNFFKKLASGLALAMVVTSFAPAAPALAATATKIVKQGGAKAPTTVYVGKKVDYSLNKVYGTNTYKWFTSNAAVAKVTKTGGVVTPVATGEATIKVNAYKKSTGKFVKSFTLKLDVKQRATSVEIGAEDFELAVGETKDLNAVKTPATSTDTLRYFSSDEKVATVDVKTGLVKAVAAGEATIKVASKGAWFTSNTSKYNKYDTVKVTVVDGLLKVEQKEHNKLALTFSSDMDKAELKTSDFSIVRDETKQVIAVSKVAVDKKSVTLTTFESLVDGKSYTITYDKKSLPFTVTDNVVSSLAISPATIANETPTEVTVSTKDANGIVLGTYKLDETEAKLDFTVETTQGYTVGNKLVLFAIGNTAKAKATWHTYKYDNNGNELGAIKTELTITAVDKTAVSVKEFKYTVAKDAPTKWDNVTPNTKLAIEDKDYKLFFYVENSDGSKPNNFTFDSSDKNVLLVSTKDGNTANVTAVSQGSAFVLVKNAKGEIIYSLAVNIVAKRVPTSLIIDKDVLTLSNGSNAYDSKDVKVELRDQYGDKMDAPSNILVTLLNTSATTGTLLSGSVTSAGTVTFNGAGVTKGTYIFRLSVGDLNRSVTVTVNEPSTDPNAPTLYQLVLDTNAVDTVFDGKTTADKLVNIKVAVLKGGVVDHYVDLGNTIDDIDSVGRNDNVVIKKGTTVVTGSAISGSTIKFVASTIDNGTVKKAATGSYSVSVTVPASVTGSNPITLNSGFVITDTQAGITLERKATSVDVANPATDIAAGFVGTFKIYYEGNEITVNPSDVTVEAITNGYSHFIKTATIKVLEGTYFVPVTVNVNETVSLY